MGERRDGNGDGDYRDRDRGRTTQYLPLLWYCICVDVTSGGGLDDQLISTFETVLCTKYCTTYLGILKCSSTYLREHVKWGALASQLQAHGRIKDCAIPAASLG
jgi:hypothetical protein